MKINSHALREYNFSASRAGEIISVCLFFLCPINPGLATVPNRVVLAGLLRNFPTNVLPIDGCLLAGEQF
jgi:hypothetical protein